MLASSNTPDNLDLLLRRSTPEVQDIVQAARAVIKEELPEAQERVHLGWNAIHYKLGASMRDVLVALDPMRTYVNLELADGVNLPDPAQRLEGTGKRMRHVKLRDVTSTQRPEVRALLRAQIAAHAARA
jgi:hypothetical protein